MLEYFRYGQLPKSINQIMTALGLSAAIIWLYYSIVEKRLMDRLLTGQAELLDALIGFPLVLALAIVIYATVVWSIKLSIIFIAPKLITLPPQDELEFTDDETSHNKPKHHRDSD